MGGWWMWASALPMGRSAWCGMSPSAAPPGRRSTRRARNAVEGRNARMEDWDLKRLPVYGLPRVKALIFLADTLDTLTTLARLVREATLAGCVT